jgi:ankyrin repeat protein
MIGEGMRSLKKLFVILTLVCVSVSAQSDAMKKLSDAIIAKDIAGVKQAIADGADVNGMTEHQQPPVIVAVVYLNPDALRILIENKASIKGLPVNPIVLGASKKHQEIISILVKAGLPMDDKKNPAVLAALQAGTHLDVIKMLVDAGADPEAENAMEQNAILVLSGTNPPKKRMEAIRTAVEDSKTKGTKILPYYNTAEESDFSGSVEIAQYLVSKGVDPAAKNGAGNGLLGCAKTGDAELAKYLIEKKADIEPSGISPLWWALRYQNPEVVKVIVDAKPDLERLHFYPAGDYAWKLSYLCEAAMNGDVRSATILLDAGAEINTTFERTESVTTSFTGTSILTKTEYSVHTALSLAAEAGHEAMAELLVSRGGKVASEL